MIDTKKVCYQLLILLLTLVMISGCTLKQKNTNWRVNLNRDNKDPYGLYLTYQSLPYLFPGVQVKDLKNSKLTNLSYRLNKNNSRSLIVIIAEALILSNTEIDSLFSLITQGHHILLSAANYGDSVCSKLNLAINHADLRSDNTQDTLFLNSSEGKETIFPYTVYKKNISESFSIGPSLSGTYITEGLSGDKLPNFVTYNIGKGKLLLHTAPIAFSNYFLLQNNNKSYLNTLFSYIPGQVEYIYWSGSNYRRPPQASDWSVVWNNRSTRYSLLLILIVLGTFVLFQSKRRQKIIPITIPPDNSSVAFVEAVGRLYYEKKDHANLARKMTQHFLEFVRSTYALNTSDLDNTFLKRLSAKSGIPVEEVTTLVNRIKQVQNGNKINVDFLDNLYKEIQLFYQEKHGI